MKAKSYHAPKKNCKPKNVKPAISEKAFYLIALILLSKESNETATLQIFSPVKMAG